MCTVSQVTGSFFSKQASMSASATAIHIVELKNNIDFYTLIDVREKEEVEKENGINGAVNIPLGSFLFQAASSKLNNYKNKKLVLYCVGAYRSAIGARELNALGFDAKYLDGGLEAWKDIAAASFDFVVVLGFNKNEVDKLSMALTFAFNAQQKSPTCLALTSDGVFNAMPNSLNDVMLGEPFVPAKKLLDNFIQAGGTIFACKSCVKLRKLEYSQMESWIHPCSAPDIVRWIKAASGSVQYI